MESGLVTVRRITLLKADVDEAIKTYIEVYHDPQLTLKNDSGTGPTFQAGMFALTKVEIVHKTTKIIDPDSTKAMAPDQNFNDLQVEAPNGKGATFGNLF